MMKWPELYHPSDAGEGNKTLGLCRMLQGHIHLQSIVSALAEDWQGIFTSNWKSRENI